MNPANITNAHHDMTTTILENHLWQWLPALSQLDRKGRAVAQCLAPRVFPKLEETFSTLVPKEAWKPFVTILFWGKVPQGQEINLHDVNYLFFHTLKALYPEHFFKLNGEQAKTVFCWMSKETVNASEIQGKLTEKTTQYKNSAISFDIQSVLKNNPMIKAYQTFSDLSNWMSVSTSISYMNCCLMTPIAGWCRYFGNTLTRNFTDDASLGSLWMKEITLDASSTLTLSQSLTIQRIFVFLLQNGINPSQSIVVDTRVIGWDMHDFEIRQEITELPLQKIQQIQHQSPYFIKALMKYQNQ